MKRAIAALLICLLVFSLIACSGGAPEAKWPLNTEKPSGEGGSSALKPPGTELTEKSTALDICAALADTYMQMCDNAVDLASRGLQYHSYYEYGRALAAISAMRLCADELLVVKGESVEDDGRLTDWDEIGALNFAEWSVWLFEGIALYMRGDTGTAETCFTNAATNPEFVEGYEDALLPVTDLNVDELKALRQRLIDYEDKIYEAYTPEPIYFPRDEYCFDGGYLMSKGLEALEGDDYAGALTCFLAAIRVDPDNADAFAAAATTCLYMEDLDGMAYYINEGLFFSPDHAGLVKLLETYKEGTKQ